MAEYLVLRGLLVNRGLGFMLLLVHLVSYSILGGASTITHRCIAILGNAYEIVRCALKYKGMRLLTLVGLLGGCGTRALNGLGDRAGSVPTNNISPVAMMGVGVRGG